jgi:hypothetical protein
MHTHTLRLDIKAFSVCCVCAYVCKRTYTRPYSLTPEVFSNTGQSYINVQSVLSSFVADLDPYVLGLQGPDPFVRGTDPDLDPLIIKQK